MSALFSNGQIQSSSHMTAVLSNTPPNTSQMPEPVAESVYPSRYRQRLIQISARQADIPKQSSKCFSDFQNSICNCLPDFLTLRSDQTLNQTLWISSQCAEANMLKGVSNCMTSLTISKECSFSSHQVRSQHYQTISNHSLNCRSKLLLSGHVAFLSICSV